MTGSNGIEDGLKYDVDDAWKMPNLGTALRRHKSTVGVRVVASAPVALRATYYDTAECRLARSGITLRFRRVGDGRGSDSRGSDSRGSDGRGGGDGESGSRANPTASTPWTVKLPATTTGVRFELNCPGSSNSAPAGLVRLLAVYTHGADLAPAIVLRTSRVTLAITAGRLAERERLKAREARTAYPHVWRSVHRGRLTGWLR